MTHEQLSSHLAAYSLGALSPEERRALEHHLAEGCRNCLQALQRYDQVVTALSMARGPAPAGAGLRLRVLTRIRATTGTNPVSPVARTVEQRVKTGSRDLVEPPDRGVD